jgi:hypothetical protein
LTLEDFSKSIIKFPENLQIPEPLLDTLYAKEGGHNRYSNKRHIVQSDLNNDGIDEYVFVITYEGWWRAKMWTLIDNKWTSQTMNYNKLDENVDLTRLLKEYGAEEMEPKWQRLKIGDIIFTVSEHE